MRLLGSLEPRDRHLLTVALALIVCAAVLVAWVRPSEEVDSYIPSAYSTAPHGAKAAYLLLERLDYREERNERPLAAVAATADAHTVLILAGPVRAPSRQEMDAVAQVLARGGRVLAAGFQAATALPEENLEQQTPPALLGGICQAKPATLLPMAAGGPVMMRDVTSVWKLDRPAQRAVYECAGRGVVVAYAAGKGKVVWWASPSPLENRDIPAPGNLELLLNSLDLHPGDRVVWDESLHAAPVQAWHPFADRIVVALLAQLLLAALLLVFSRGRRSGPLRPLPAARRSSPLEFVRALGRLYRASGAADVPVRIAYDRFRALLVLRYGIVGAPAMDPGALATAVAQRYGLNAHALRSDLTACDEAAGTANITPREALYHVQSLARWRGEIARHAASNPYFSQHRGDRGTHSGDDNPIHHRTA